MFFQVFNFQCFLNQHFFTLHTDVGWVAGAKGSRQFYPKLYELSLNETVLLDSEKCEKHMCSEVFRGYSYRSLNCDRSWQNLRLPRYPNFSASMRFRVEQDMVMLGREGWCMAWSKEESHDKNGGISGWELDRNSQVASSDASFRLKDAGIFPFPQNVILFVMFCWG